MYKSPLHILSGLDDQADYSEPGYLLRVRKKLLAEFDLSNSVTITVNGREYSKDEVIKAIDVLMGDPLMPMHSFVFANKRLLDFLENDASKVRLAEIRSLVVPEAIQPQLSTVLVERLSQNMRKSFHHRDFERGLGLLQLMPMLLPADAGELNEEINRGIRNIENHVRAVTASQLSDSPRELMYLRRIPLADFLNQLPDAHHDAINAFAAAVINMMVSYQKLYTHDRSFLYYVSNMLCRLRVDDDIRKLIQSNHIIFMKNHESAAGDAPSPGIRNDTISGKRILYIAVVAVIFLFRILVTCNRSSSSSYSYNTNFEGLNNLKSILAESSKRSNYESFKDYRKHIQDETQRPALEATVLPTVNLVNDSVLSGENPLSLLLHESYIDPQDTSYRRVVIKNKTANNLIIIAFDDADARATYFLRNKPDTLVFLPHERLCLYFGDSLMESPFKEVTENSPILRFMGERRFRHMDEAGYETLQNDYEIVLKSSANKKSKKKKAPLPVIRLDDTFFETNGYEDNKVKLQFIGIFGKDFSGT